MVRSIFIKAELRNLQIEKVKNFLDFIVLRLLKNQPMHGYGIILTIRNLYGYYPAPSTIYSLLSTFEKKKYAENTLEVRNGKSRKVYSITPQGKAILDFEEELLNHIINLANPKVRERR